VIVFLAEVSAMYLEASAMMLLELHRTFEADRRRETLAAARRVAALDAMAASSDGSDPITGVPVRDRAGRGGEAGADLGRVQDLEPGTGAEKRQGRLVRPAQAHPKS
jgi:hypothetical protein